MSRDTRDLHPDLQVIIPKFLQECRKKGLEVRITDCYRTVAEQDTLYAQGRTKPGAIVTNCKGSEYASPHQWGVAFDICRNDGKGAYDDSGGFFAKCGNIGKNMGLQWGGAWSDFIDKPHFQIAKFFDSKIQTVAKSKMKNQYGTYAKFRATWGKSSIKDNWSDLTITQLTGKLKSYYTVKIKTKCKYYKKANIVSGDYTTLKVGTIIEWLEDLGSGWSKIKYQGNNGYVKNSTIDRSGLSKYKTGTIKKLVELRSARKVAKSTLLNKQLKAGTKVTIVSVVGKWVQIKYKINKKSTDCWVVKNKINL